MGGNQSVEESEVSREGFEEANLVGKLHSYLMHLTEENLQQTEDLILNSVFVMSSMRIGIIARSVLLASECRPMKITLLAQLCCELNESASEENNLSELKDVLKQSLLFPEGLSSNRLFLLRQCLKRNLFSSEEIVRAVGQFVQQHPTLNNSAYLLVTWFAPEIQQHDSLLWENVFHRMTEEMELNALKPEMSALYDNLSELQKNDWELLKKRIEEGANPDSIAVLLRNDDIEHLHKIVKNTEEFNLNRVLNTSIFDSVDFVNHGCNLIQYAAYFGAVNCFNFLLESGASVKGTDKKGNGLFHYIIAGGSTELFEIALQKEWKTSGSLQIAARYYYLGMFDRLSKLGGESVTAIIPNYNSVIHQCAEGNDVRLLAKILSSPCGVDLVTKDGVTPFLTACEYGSCEVLRLLMAHKRVDVNHTNKLGETGLFIASSKNFVDVVKILLSDERVDANIPNKANESPLYIASKNGNLESVRLLVSNKSTNCSHKDDYELTPLHWAVRNNHLEIVKILVGCNAVDINAADYLGQTPLHYACASGLVEVANILLQSANINVNMKNKTTWTPLRCAVENSQIEIIKMLLKRKDLDVNICTREFRTARDDAELQGKQDIVDLIDAATRP